MSPRSSAKLATIVVAVLGGLSVATAFAFALATSAPSAPRIIAHPPKQTNSRVASFRFTASEAKGTFLCSMDASPYRKCTSPIRYRMRRLGRNVFRVEARSGSGSVSSPASYAWKIGAVPPLNVVFPQAHGVYGAASWPVGCSARLGVCGTVHVRAGVNSVTVWIKQDATGRYWNGRSYVSQRSNYRSAVMSPKPRQGKGETGARWFYSLPLPSPNGQYTLRVRATDRIHKITRFRAQQTVTFTIGTIGTIAPAPPVITAGSPSGAALPLTIGGDAQGLLYPGGAKRMIPLTLTNPNDVAIVVTALTVAVQNSSLPAGCSVNNYQVAQASIPSAGIDIPADGSVTLPTQQATEPSIQMIETYTNQDPCQQADLDLSYAGSAHS